MEERDVGKVVGCVRWLGWLIDEAAATAAAAGSGRKEDEREGSSDDDDNENNNANDNEEGLRVWNKALEGIKEKVQEAVEERGLGRLEL